MPVSFEAIQVGSRQDIKQLAVLWGYSGYQAIARGVVTPKGTPYIIFFITKERRSTDKQYQNELADGRLKIDGEEKHGNDLRYVNAKQRGDQIHLFYRERHSDLYTYKGQMFLGTYELRTTAPSRFEFSLDADTATALSDLETEALTHGVEIDTFFADEEGRQRIRTHISYERSAKNRARALKVHGTKCLACGFDFDACYGTAHAESYIEVHHINPVASGTAIRDPEKDLAPLCSNCHSMAHRRKGMSLGISEIKALIAKAKLTGKSSGSF